MVRFVYFVLILILMTGCQILNKEEETKSFLIVDQSSNKVLNDYEYSKDDNTLLRTTSYNSNEQVKKSIEYEYDSKGNLTKTVESSVGSPQKTIIYITNDIYDDNGRLIKTIRTSSEGELLETFYGYDENNILRGVVEQLNKGSVIMKDYNNY